MHLLDKKNPQDARLLASRTTFAKILHGCSLTVGLHAPRGTGKDTTASNFYRHIHGTTNIFSFASPLYGAVSALTGLSVQFLADQANKNRPLTPDDTPVKSLHGKTIRKLLELMGTEIVRDQIHPDHFVCLMEAKLATRSNGCLFFVTDLRFRNEAALCDVVVELRRDGDMGYSDEHESRKRLPEQYIDATYKLPNGDTSVDATCAFTEWLAPVITESLDVGKKQFRRRTLAQELLDESNQRQEDEQRTRANTPAYLG